MRGFKASCGLRFVLIIFDVVGLPSFYVEVLYSSVYANYLPEILISKTYFMDECVFVFDSEALYAF